MTIHNERGTLEVASLKYFTNLEMSSQARPGRRLDAGTHHNIVSLLTRYECGYGISWKSVIAVDGICTLTAIQPDTHPWKAAKSPLPAISIIHSPSFIHHHVSILGLPGDVIVGLFRKRLNSHYWHRGSRRCRRVYRTRCGQNP